MSAEQCQGSRRNDRLKISKGFFGALVIFTVTDFKFWRICLVNISVGMVYRLTHKHVLERIISALSKWGQLKRVRQLLTRFDGIPFHLKPGIKSG